MNMKKVTRWRTNTCGCIFDYECDDSIPQDERKITLNRIVHKCEIHQGIEDNKTAFSTVVEECKRKSFIFVVAKECCPSLKFSDYSWRFDKNRKLIIDFGPSITATDITKIQTECNLVFGIDKIVIEADKIVVE